MRFSKNKKEAKRPPVLIFDLVLLISRYGGDKSGLSDVWNKSSSYLLERTFFNLANSLAGDRKMISDFLQSHRSISGHPLLNYIPFLIIETCESLANFPLE